MRQILYVAHCLRPTEGEILAASRETYPNVPLATMLNARRALAWRLWLRDTFADVTFVAPWIGDILCGVDDDSEPSRALGMRDNCALVERLDGIVLCGPRISSGMRAEVETFTARATSGAEYVSDVACVYDLTSLGATPPQPGFLAPGTTFEHWVGTLS